VGQCSTEKIRREEISKEKVKTKMISGGSLRYKRANSI